jgi:hypothetical protein
MIKPAVTTSLLLLMALSLPASADDTSGHGKDVAKSRIQAGAMGKPARPGGNQRLYPAPDGKGDYCTRPWKSGSTGKPFCPGDIVETN